MPQLGLLGGASYKEPDCQRRRGKRHGFVPWVRKIPGGGHGNPLQYSCLENPTDRGALAGYSPQSRKEVDTTEMTSMHACASNYLNED